MKRLLFMFASLYSITVARDAFAANACVTAADKGQDLRSAGKLDEARATLMVCAKSSCNRVVRADCERWIKEIDEEKAAQAEEKEREKEQRRAEKAEKAEKAAAAAAPSVVATPAQTRATIAIAEPPSSQAAPTSTFPVAPAVLGGLGVLSLAAFGYFQVQGWSRYSSLEDGCAKTHSCTDAEIDNAKTPFVASGAALGVSVVSFGVAAILYFTRGSDSASQRIGVRPGGAAVSF